MIEPTIGRVVLFWPTLAYARDKGMAYEDSGKPLPAIITYVHGARMVNLAVFDQNGENYPVTSVPLVQDGEPAPNGSFYCEWMPYQKGQAAKTEALEKAAACRGCGPQHVAEGSSVERVRLFLNRGSLVKVNGIPVELEHDAVVLVHAGNVPLLAPESVNACDTQPNS